MNHTKYLIVGGNRLEITWHGPSPKEAPTLVFLHDGLGCVAKWRDFPSSLAAATGCGALVYSRAGAGAEVLMLPDCGHIPHREQPFPTFQTMTDFISRIFS